MQFIVLDLEWNQPMSYRSPEYKKSGGKLLFEMIQIGAVKLNDQREVVDSFSQLIQPTCYLQLHPRISRITQISQDDLADAPQFPEALQLFETWCGQDYILLTWGCDDISVLQQNITYFGCENHLSGIYDMQRLFGEIVGDAKDRKSLKTAMEYYQIDPSEEKSFHNAVNDAYYTSLVFAHMPEPEKVLNYPLTAKTLMHTERVKKRGSISIFRINCKEEEMLNTQGAQQVPCPVCGIKQDLSVGYVQLSPNSHMALAVCPHHGLMMVKINFKKSDDGKRIMERCISLSEEQHKAYVSTKLLQWENKLKKQEGKK